MDLAKYLTIFFKTLTFTVLLIAFCKFYLISEVEEFLKQSTTFSSRYEEIEHIQFPNLIFCMKPGVKTSVTKKFGYKDESSIFYDTSEVYKTKNKTFWQTYHELSYNYSVDFTIKPTKINFMPTLDFKIESVEELATFYHGLCHLIIINKVAKISSMWVLELTFDQDLDPEDLPRKLGLYLTSNDTWYGLINDEWPFKDNLFLQEIEIDFEPQNRIGEQLEFTAFEMTAKKFDCFGN